MNWEPSRRSSCNSPTTWSSTTSGGGPISVCGTAAWSPSPRSPRWATTTSSISYLRRALESGLTRAQITEALTHLGFYAGWPKATKAMAAVTRSLGK